MSRLTRFDINRNGWSAQLVIFYTAYNQRDSSGLPVAAPH